VPSILTDLTEIIDTLTELKRMHQLNYELLEQLNVTCDYLLTHYPNLPNNKKLASLLSKSMSVLKEIKTNSPKILVYQNLSDERKHRDDSDGKVPVPKSGLFIGG
jgi:hypothetical protein